MKKNQLSIKRVLLDSFSLYRKTFAKVWYFAAMAGLLNVIAGFLTKTKYFLNLNNSASVWMILIMFFCCHFIFGIYLSSLTLHKIHVIDVGSKANSFSFVNKKYFKVVLGVLLLFVLFIIGTFILFLPISFFGKMLSNMLSMVFFSAIFLFVFGIFYMTTSLVQSLILFDDKKIKSILSSSYKLVSGNLLNVFLVFLCIIFPFCAASIAIYLFTVNQLIILGSFTLINFIFYPFHYACIIVMFGKLKALQKAF